jgi:hypothetical protein
MEVLRMHDQIGAAIDARSNVLRSRVAYRLNPACRSLASPAWRCILVVTLATVDVDPAWAQQPARWTVSEDFRYPEATQAPLTAVQHIVALPDGSIVVRDRFDPGVLLFDAAGRLVRRIGQRGRGPGDFGQLGGSVGLFGDTIWAADTQGWSIQVFSPEGSLLRGPFTYAARRELVGFRRDDHAIAVAMFDTTGAMFLEFGLAASRHAETSAAVILPLNYGDQQLSIPLPHQGELKGIRNRFVRRDYVAVEPAGGGVAVVRQPPSTARDGQVDVVMYALDGVARWSTSFSYRLEPVTRRAVDEWIDGLEPLKRMVEAGVFTLELARRTVHANYRPPAYLPAISTSGPSPWLAGSNAVHVDATGLVWVRLWSETWHVVGPGGVVATLELPDGLLVKAISERHLWGVMRDALGVPTIVRYRLQRRT